MDKKRLALCVASFISQFSINAVNFALIYFMREKFSLSSSIIGIAASLNPITYFISCLLLSPFYGKIKRRTKVFLAFFGMATSVAVALFTTHVSVLFIMLALYGVALSFLWPNIEEWITEGKEGRELSKATNAFNFSWSFGAGLSTMVAGFLSEISISLPIALSIFFFLCVLVFLLALARGDEGVKKEKKEERAAEDNSTPLRYFAWGGNFLNYACYALILNIFPLYAVDFLGLSEAGAGTLMLFRGLSTCLSFILFTRFKFWQFNKKAIILSQSTLAVLFITFSYLRSSFSIAIFFTLFGIVFALLYEMSIFHGATGAINREKRMIIHEVLLNIGSVLGSVLGGIIYEIFSFRTILYMLSVMALVFVLVELSILFFASKRAIRL